MHCTPTTCSPTDWLRERPSQAWPDRSAGRHHEQRAPHQVPCLGAGMATYLLRCFPRHPRRLPSSVHLTINRQKPSQYHSLPATLLASHAACLASQPPDRLALYRVQARSRHNLRAWLVLARGVPGSLLRWAGVKYIGWSDSPGSGIREIGLPTAHPSIPDGSSQSQTLILLANEGCLVGK
jgi:hypothetical protein